jgi:tetratricopeptide (TPR) repeat protein
MNSLLARGRVRWGRMLGAAAAALAALWAYGPALRGAWVWDDDVEVVQNRVLRDPAGWWTPWVRPAGQDYFPLKSTLQWLQWRLWGDRVAGYHLTNLALHLLSAWLIWRLLERLGLRWGWVGGLWFALHPLAVESTAWIAEFKNALSLPLLLGAMIAYLEFDGRRSASRGGRSLGEGPTSMRLPPGGVDPAPRGRAAPPYLLSLFLFVLAMLAKSTVVMFPFAILLHAWWRRGRIGASDLGRSAPFFAVSLALGLVTMAFQAHRAIGAAVVTTAGLGARLGGAGLAGVFYLGKSLWPAGLMPIYPRWPDDRLGLGVVAWLAAAGAGAWLWRRRQGWGRTAIFGLGFFLLNLAPVVGVVPMAFDRLSWVSDHLAYVSLVGIVGLAAAAADAAGRRRPAVTLAVVILAAAALGAATRAQAATFADAESLWAHAVRLNPLAPLARNNLGIALADRHRTGEAIVQYRESLRLDPTSAEVRTNLANSLAEAGRRAEAEAQYREALRIEPRFAGAHFNFAKDLAATGRTREAIAEYREALRLDPENASAAYEMADALVAEARLPEAAEAFRRAVGLQPGFADAHLDYGNVLAQLGRAPEAIGEYQAVLRLEPEAADVRNNLGSLLAEAGRLAEARVQFREALRLKPDYAEARENLQRLDAMSGAPNVR